LVLRTSKTIKLSRGPAPKPELMYKYEAKAMTNSPATSMAAP
jgi:hypothetical protein